MVAENSIYNKVTLIIVTYKSRDNILSNLKAMKNFKTIIVDNSNDLVFKNTLSKYKNIHYECLKKILVLEKQTTSVLVWLQLSMF